ncbi:MAG: 16S rRNA (uracil(1498)-N(3))-methyltransferase [Chloroflexi bacterium]|nr:16S rRNA (uracil(1498)-N(3))-methyltransferase [Chloroflexota bacterium]
MHRFFVTPEAIAGGRLTLAGDQARQVARVLRLAPGDRITVLDNSGQEYVVELTAVRPDAAQGRVVTVTPAPTEPALHLTLYQALLKADKFEWVLQKGTEVGISAFVPVWAERSILPLEAAEKKLGRWTAVLQEAAEQAHRARLPVLGDPIPLRQAFHDRALPVLLPWEGEQCRGLRTALEALGPVERLGLVIGPEGGFAEREVEAAVAAGALPVSLGPRILRAETAGLVAAAAILYHYGQWGG